MNGFEKISQETLDLVKGSMDVSKAVTTGTGLVGYSLEAPSKHLVPFLSPLRNVIPRKVSATGTSVNWKAITAVSAGGKVTTTEGNRGNSISYTVEDRVAAFKTFGLQDSVTLEAIAAGRNFEDVRAMASTNLLLKVMTEEEKLILGGNTVAYGDLSAPTGTAADGGALEAGSVYYAVAALNLVAANGVPLNQTIDNLVLGTEGVSKAISAAAAITATANQKITMTVAAKKGAFAYAWFAGATAAGMTLQAVTTVNSFVLTALTTGGTAVTGFTADKSADADSFSGIIPQALAGGGYYLNKAGAKLTAGRAAIVEMDEINSYMFANYKCGITRWLVSEQVARDITDAIIGSTGAPQLFINSAEQGSLTANYVVKQYINKSFGGQIQVIEVHPWLPQGTMVGLTESLPYPNANVPSVLEMEMGYDYMQLEYAFQNPKYEFEVRAYGALKHYFPIGTAVVQGILKGI